MKLYFVTGNRYKVEEAKALLKEYGIGVVQLKLEKNEPKHDGIIEVAKKNALAFAKKLKKPIVVEDTGFFYHAYKSFPGSHPRMMYELLGYKGLLKLMEGRKKRGAEFRSAVAYSDGKKTKVFVGKLVGKITKRVYGRDMDTMPYERIFIPKGYQRALTYMPRSEKNLLSHRAKAFKALGKYLIRKK